MPPSSRSSLLMGVEGRRTKGTASPLRGPRRDNLANLTVRGNNIGFNTITGEDHIVDGSLTQEDIAEATLVNFSLVIGPIAAHDCTIAPVSGLNAQGDHLLLTPNITTGGGRVVYSA